MRKTYLTVLAILAAIAMILGCGSGSSGDDSAEADSLKQTWPKNYSDTTCAEWSKDMTEHQRFVAAADMLTGARNKGDGGTGLPPDSLITDFESGITNVCDSPQLSTQSLADIGAGLYLTDRARFRP